MMKTIRLMGTLMAGGIAAYALWLRPRHLRWGATEADLHKWWPGDDWMPDPVTESTRAVTIDASVQEVWQWLAQIGQDRGGFYSYTPLENAIGANMTNADRIHPEWQHREVGEKVWLGDPAKYDGKAFLVVAEWIPRQAIVLVTGDDWRQIREGGFATKTVWAFFLEPLGDGKCRLIARSRGGVNPDFSAGKIGNAVFWEPEHFVMERAMLLGIKERAERRAHARLAIDDAALAAGRQL
jgi:hypothetical protein